MERPSNAYSHEKTRAERVPENPLYGVMSHDEFVLSGAQPSEDEFKVFYARGVGMEQSLDGRNRNVGRYEST